MKIQSITIGKLKIPLIRPFITAVRRTEHVEDIVVQIKSDTGKIGYGSAAATPVITGDTSESITAAIQNILAPKLLGRSIEDFNSILHEISNALKRNTSAKAAVDMALHDLRAQHLQVPLFKLLGGANNRLKTCITISAKNTDAMVQDAQTLLKEGFDILKIKVGADPQEDLERILKIRAAIDPAIKVWIDANQGWNVKTALKIIHSLQKNNVNINFIEQPVIENDLKGLAFIRDNCQSLIIADESCFSPQDALRIVELNGADVINIKLMKSGGIHQAQAIYEIVKSANLQCVVGCMLESPIGIAAMASFALSKPQLAAVDLDALFLIKNNPVKGGAQIEKNAIVLPDKPGLGIDGLTEFTLIVEIKA